MINAQAVLTCMDTVLKSLFLKEEEEEVYIIITL